MKIKVVDLEKEIDSIHNFLYSIFGLYEVIKW